VYKSQREQTLLSLARASALFTIYGILHQTYVSTATLKPSNNIKIYEGCSESNAPHFFSRKLFNQNVWNSCTI